MQNYLEFNFKIKPLQPWNEILMAELIEIGFDSFTEEYDGILAYVQKELLNETKLKSLDLLNNPDIEITYTS
ncbi:MAG: 50S ribosomal protein L11 methyltransferase, partial [Chryseobacterium sp.]|nr:50S ribosomal protein L11 methyltransferase [Chryseobacterium sp.]